MEGLSLTIKEKSLALGYAGCGIINVNSVAEYGDQLKERMSRVPFGWLQFWQFRKLAHPHKANKWAKSIIVTLHENTIYNIPEKMKGLYAKDFLTDGRLDKESDAWKRQAAFGEFLDSMGIRYMIEPKFGITALRLAAQNAGLGIIRSNNFFYSENGSSVTIEAWLIDKELELIDSLSPKKCPEHCRKCVEACPTKALSAPYTTSLFDCVSFITSLSVENGLGIPSVKKRTGTGGWVYGCDACQDACPFNKNKWKGGRDFPGLNDLAEKILPEKLMAMEYTDMNQILAGKFWYISKKNLWKWKINALSAIANTYSEYYRDSIMLGLRDEDKRVRRYAKWVCKKAGIGETSHDKVIAD